MYNLEKSILKTLAYFDIFDYPLTLVEIHKWLYQPGQSYTLREVSSAIDNMPQVNSKFGFYFLAGRQDSVQVRLHHYQLAEKKFKIALKAAAWLRWLPFVKMISVCNNVGYNNASEHSDIDFFIISQKRYLWWTRLTVTLVTTLLGIRRKGDKVVDRVCLSFYIGSDHLNLQDIALPEVDPYLVYWFATLAPIYDTQVYDDFLASNGWVKQYLPNFYPTLLNSRRKVEKNRNGKVSKLIDSAIFNTPVGLWLEKIASRIQADRVSKYFGSSIGEQNSNVVISDSMLKLHKTDRRQLYKDSWLKKYQDLNNFKSV